MTPETNLITPQNDWDALIDLVTQSVDSPHSKRAYSRALIDFLDWYDANGHPAFSKATINAYREQLLQSGKSRSSINQALSAIRKLSAEAADNGFVPPTLAYGIERVKGVKQEGVRAGNWLTRDEAEKLINEPLASWRRNETPLLTALRDCAILALLIGTGLRRSEAAELTWEHIQQRDARWAIIDLMGKNNRIRSIGVPSWTKAALDRWADHAQVQNGRIFRALNKNGSLAGSVKTKHAYKTDGNLTAQAIYNMIKKYGRMLGQPKLAVHDTRRTAAALALHGGADIRQIQQMLGHASIQTTERYLEPVRSLAVAAPDFIDIEIMGV